MKISAQHQHFYMEHCAGKHSGECVLETLPSTFALGALLALWERGVCSFVEGNGNWFLYVHTRDAETKPLPPPQPSHAAQWLTRDDETGRGAILGYHPATPPLVPGPLPPPELPERPRATPRIAWSATLHGRLLEREEKRET